jgi:GntP family gluconate:H+ symporter
MATPVETALASGGLIILITAAGGSFGGMLRKAGVGEALEALSNEAGISALLLRVTMVFSLDHRHIVQSAH